MARGLYPIDWAGNITDLVPGSVSFHNCARMPDATLALLSCLQTCAASGNCARMPDARWRVLSCLQTCAGSVGRIRRHAASGGCAPMPDTYINAPITSTPAHPALRYTTAHAAPAQQSRIARQQRTQLRRHQQHRVFPAAFICSFTCGIVLWNWLTYSGQPARCRASLCRPVAPDHHIGEQIFQLIIQRIHRQLLLRTNGWVMLRRSARRTSAATEYDL